jgi:hypothetical protein
MLLCDLKSQSFCGNNSKPTSENLVDRKMTFNNADRSILAIEQGSNDQMNMTKESVVFKLL